MKWRWGFCALAAVAALFAVTIFYRQVPDPVFEGRAASQWAEDLLSSDYTAKSEAQGAFIKMGETGLQQLRVLLQRRNSPWEKYIVEAARHFPVIKYKNRDSVLSRQRGAEMAALLGAIGAPLAPDLIHCLKIDAVAPEAERALVKIGRDSIPHLRDSLRNASPEIRGRSARLLREFKPASAQTVEALCRMKDDKSPLARREAALSLGEMPKEFPSVSTTLIELSGDPEESVRASAAQALGEFGLNSPDVARRVGEMLADESVLVRLEAAKAAWKLHHDPGTIVNTLIPLVASSEGWQAAYALGDMGAAAAPAVPALVEALKKERVPRPFRTPPSAAFALGQIGSQAVPEVCAVLNNRNAAVRTAAVMALGFMGSEGAASAPRVLPLLSDPDPDVRNASALTLASIGANNEQVINALREALAAEDIYMRSSALDALRKLAPGVEWAAAAAE